MHFNSVSYKEMGTNPAQVNRTTGDLYLNPLLWPTMPESFKRIILLHEEGHLKGGPGGTPTASETEADLYAFRRYKNTEPGSLKKSVVALNILLGESPEATKRKLLIYSAALLEDWQHNKNPKALVEYHNVRGELERDYNFSLPMVAGKDSNWIGAVIGLVVTAAGYVAKAKADKNAKDLNDAYGIAATTAQGNAGLSQIYELEAQRDQAKKDSVNMKYLIIVSTVFSVAFLAWWYFIKKGKAK